MRGHGKASIAESIHCRGTGRATTGGENHAGGTAEPAGLGSSAPPARRLVLPVSVFVFITILALMAAAIPASATKTHLLEETFGSAAQPNFGNSQALTVDQSTGDLLVVDSSFGTVSRYNSDGTPANFSALGTHVIDGTGLGDETPQNGLFFGSPTEAQIAVDNSGEATDGNIYVTQSGQGLIDIFASTGAYLGQLNAAGATAFGQPCGVAVDSSGAVYVGDYPNAVHKFVPAANPPVNADHTASFTTVSNPCAVAAGAGPTAGFLFVAENSGGVSKIDSATGELKYVVDSGSNTTISVDPGTGRLFAAQGEEVKEFDVSGAGSASVLSSIKVVGTVKGVAVEEGGGDIYLSRTSSSNLDVFDGAIVTLPDVSTTAATASTGTSATLNGTVNPDGAELEECFFEYGKTTGYGQTVPCAETPVAIGSGTSPVPVHADLSGLEAGTVYHYRLLASNANGLVPGQDMTLQTLGPTIVDMWTESAVRTEATLKVTINPAGLPASFHVEYGTDTSYGSETSEITVGSDSSNHTIGVVLDGLQPGTTYHWRVVASNADAVNPGPDRTVTTYQVFATDTNCPNQAFRIGPAASLPDCRGYEMVSPVDKNGGDIATLCNINCFRTAFNQSSLDGGKFTYSSAKAFGDAVAGAHSNQYLATRGADGWSSKGISPPRRLGLNATLVTYDDIEVLFKDFSDDLSSAWVYLASRDRLTPDALQDSSNIYRRDNTDGSYEALTINELQTPPKLKLTQPQMQGHSSDGKHVLFIAEAPLTPDAAEGTRYQLYDFSEGKLHLVSVLPDGTANTGESWAGTRSSGVGGATHGVHTLEHAISEDGSRVFWSSGFQGGGGTGEIYLRENPAEEQSVLNGGGECTEPAKACTTHIAHGRFWTATPDGSKMLFDDASGGGALQIGALSIFDVETSTTIPVASSAVGVLGTSDDFSRIYFVSKENLATGASAGQPNLYLDHEGTKTFIATLSPLDVGEASSSVSINEYSVVSPRPLNHHSRVTPDGRHIAFQSSRSLTGYDNTARNNGEAAVEIYAYDADAGQLTCVSCNPSGARPIARELQLPFTTGNTPYEDNGGPLRVWAAAWLTTAENSLHTPRALSDDGSHLFFNSFDALLPEDANGVQDVYEWEAQGTGACQEAGGCLSLISTGQSAKKSEFIDATPDGSNVFIETASSIDPRDPGLIDIYDARTGGGFPPPLPPVGCEGDACQSIPPASNDPTPASASFRGAEDPKRRKAGGKCKPRHRRNASSSKAERKQAKKRCRRARGRAGR